MCIFILFFRERVSWGSERGWTTIAAILLRAFSAIFNFNGGVKVSRANFAPMESKFPLRGA